jgi:hypothetical protein
MLVRLSGLFVVAALSSSRSGCSCGSVLEAEEAAETRRSDVDDRVRVADLLKVLLQKLSALFDRCRAVRRVLFVQDWVLSD